jgi:hypothetical protein
LSLENPLAHRSVCPISACISVEASSSFYLVRSSFLASGYSTSAIFCFRIAFLTLNFSLSPQLRADSLELVKVYVALCFFEAYSNSDDY